MSKQDRAAQVIRTWQQRHKNVMDSNPDWAAQNLAIDLCNEELIAPDLPEPSHGEDGAKVWSDGEVWLEDDDKDVYTDLPKSTSWMTPNRARKLALALLAAANYVEEK